MGRAREESDWAGAELGMVGLEPGQAWVGLRKGEVGGMGFRGQGQGKDQGKRKQTHRAMSVSARTGTIPYSARRSTPESG